MVGLDSTEPEFKTYRMRLLYIEFGALALVFPALWGYLWFTRDRSLDAIAPKEEIRRYFTLTMWISIYTFAVSANHIIEFYFNFPLYVLWVALPGSTQGPDCPFMPRAFRFR